MADRSKRAVALWSFIAAMLLVQAAWAGAQTPPGDVPTQPGPGARAPAGGHAVLWLQEPPATSEGVFFSQDTGIVGDDSKDTYVADDFTTSHHWSIDTIFVPGDTWGDPCGLSCADSLNWHIYPDAGGTPFGDPSSTVPTWSLSLSPSDPRITLSPGAGGQQTNVLLELAAPFTLGPRTWWLVFFPTMREAECDCYYGWYPCDTARLSDAQVINPGGGAALPTNWTSVTDSTTFNSGAQDMAFRLEGYELPWLGDLVWYDTDQDGVQDVGEPGVAGIDVNWYGTADCSGPSTAHAYSDSTGIYTFAPPATGDQCLHFFDIPKGWSISPQDKGLDDAVDSDADPTTAQIRIVGLEKDDTSQDVGLHVKGSLSGRVWCDNDCDAKYDSGEELANGEVEVFFDPSCIDAVAFSQGSVRTDSNGKYTFSDLPTGPPGDPVCYDIVLHTNTLGGCSQPLTTDYLADIELHATSPASTGNNFAMSRGLRIAGKAWYDFDQDGLRDGGEASLEKITAHLHSDAQCSGAAAQTETTNTAGAYCFQGLSKGAYCVQFKTPTGWTITAQDQGSNDKVDSDASPATGQIASINLNQDRLYESIGAYTEGSISGHVFCDADGDYDHDAGEGMKQMLVSFYYDTDCDHAGDGAVSARFTDGQGAYHFDAGVVGPAGDPVCFIVSVDPPAGDKCNIPVTLLGRFIELDTGLAHKQNIDFGFRSKLGEQVYLPFAWKRGR